MLSVSWSHETETNEFFWQGSKWLDLHTYAYLFFVTTNTIFKHTTLQTVIAWAHTQENLEGPVNRKLNASQNKEPFKGSSDDRMKTQQSKGINSEIRVCY